MKAVLLQLSIMIFIASICRAGEERGGNQYVRAALAQAAAKPETLNLRAALLDPATTQQEKNVISFKLNAIFAAAQASGQLEYQKALAAKNAASADQLNRLMEAQALARALRGNP